MNPVVIQPIVKQLNLVIKSPKYDQIFLKNKSVPPTKSPNPAPSSP